MKNKKSTPSTNVSDCTFTGVHWDAQSIGTIQTVADGLLANTKALHALIDVFKSQSIQMSPFINIQQGNPQ